MNRPKYLALNVKLGLAGSFPIGDDRITFHEKAVRLVYGSKKDWLRLGLSQTSPFDFEQIASNTAYISELVDSARNTVLGAAKKFDVLLLDFSNNEFDLLREPILMQLADVFYRLCSEKICNSFLLLLPELPAPETASIQHFSRVDKLPKKYRLSVISNDGSHILVPEKGWKVSSLEIRYQKLTRRLEQPDASQLFEKKIVRRLGHFKRAKHGGGCRLYSYATDNCTDELEELIKTWWSNCRIKPKAIVYDSRNNPSLAQAIKAFAASKKLFFQRVDDVVSMPEIAKDTSSRNPCLLIVDVIETGGTLLRHADHLKAVGVDISRDVLAAISKGPTKQVKIGQFNVTSFASKTGEPETADCVQCRLGLPLTSDDEESFLKLRSFDIWEMASAVGWEAETDVPDHRNGYEVVPRFPEMLKRYGDWIAYKMEHLYKSFPHPDNVFVIHPEEDGAIAVSENLQIRFRNKLTVIKVPRPAMKLARDEGSWKKAIEKWDGDDGWLKQLESLGDASAIITDIFNASGTTFRSILDLLTHFDLRVLCYFPVVDRDCIENSEKYSILRYSLYDWYGSRPLKAR